jgi:hypothetical protein
MLSRRALIGKAAVGAAAALALGTARTGIASTRAFGAAPDDPADGRDRHAGDGDGPADDHVGPAGDRDAQNASPPPADAVAPPPPPPWELVSPLAAGAVVAHGWRLAELSPVQHGSCVATLENARGRAHRIHLCRNDGSPQGLVYTRRVDLVVMNGGQGDLPTEEGFAQAVAELAHVVAANEARTAPSVFADLLPHSERVQRFAASDGTPSMAGKLR